MLRSLDRFNSSVQRVYHFSTCSNSQSIYRTQRTGRNESVTRTCSAMCGTLDVRCSKLNNARQFHNNFTSQQKFKEKENVGHKSTQITESRDTPFSELTLGQKVQQAGKDVTYTGIIILGVGITGIMFYAIGRELFSGQSPSGVYSRAVKLCNNSDKVKDSIGEPMKAYGEMSSRGRRRHVRSNEYEVNGVKHMVVQFYLEGPHNKGTVHAEVKQDDRGKYQFERVLMELEGYPRRVVVIEDHR